jgi:site-specific DNA-methyltransferase (adenine-specific)
MELANGRVVLRAGDCLEILASLPENSIDAVVTDPPYELGFMGKSWDASGIAFCPDTWRLIWRVLKPGGHMVAFGAPKNYHRLACAIEDAGFEIRDSLMWVFGTGFPKSMDVSKAIDATLLHGGSHSRMIKKAIADRPGEFRETATLPNNGVMSGERRGGATKDEAATEEAANWQGWGTALKPAYEPIVLARKPLSEKTVAANVLRWGTGALNIDATRIETDDTIKPVTGKGTLCGTRDGYDRPWKHDPEALAARQERANAAIEKANTMGRWPANLCHDGSQQVLDLFPQTGKSAGGSRGSGQREGWGMKSQPEIGSLGFGDEGSAARFFYSAKASKADRAGSKHPTVKPVSLMQWLVRMVTPSGGKVLDPFAGSGTTGQAAVNEGFDAVLIERELEYQTDIRNRLDG